MWNTNLNEAPLYTDILATVRCRRYDKLYVDKVQRVSRGWVGWTDAFGKTDLTDLEEVIAWMPMPEPTKEG